MALDRSYLEKDKHQYNKESAEMEPTDYKEFVCGLYPVKGEKGTDAAAADDDEEIQEIHVVL